MTDNEGRTARETMGVVLGLSKAEREGVKVYTSRQYLIQADMDDAGAHRIAKDLLANELIQRFEYKSAARWAEEPGFEAKAARVTGQASDEVAVIPLSTMSDDELMDFSRANTLALSLKELHDIRAYFADPAIKAEREKMGLSAEPDRRRDRSPGPDLVRALQAQDFLREDRIRERGDRQDRRILQPVQDLHPGLDQADPRPQRGLPRRTATTACPCSRTTRA